MSDDMATASVPCQRSGADLVEAAVVAYFAAWAAMTSTLPVGTYSAQRGVARARLGLPAPAFNGVWGLRRDVHAQEVLAAVEEFAADDLPWNVQLRPGYPEALDDELAARGLVVTADVPFMVLPDLTTVAAPGSPAMREVVSFRDVDAAVSLLEQGFGIPPELARGMFPVRMMFLPGTTTWIANDHADVSTALSTVHGDMCGIFNVATPAEHRGRGYGRAVTAQAIATSGARSAYLQSSPMGVRVYEALGFETAELWRQWMPSAYVDH